MFLRTKEQGNFAMRTREHGEIFVGEKEHMRPSHTPRETFRLEAVILV
jgi:hypothetical protein